MGNHLATIDTGRKLGVCHFWGKLGFLTQCRLRRGLAPYQVVSWSIQPFGHNRYRTKIGGCAPFGEGKLGPNLRQCGLGWGLPLYQVASWSVQPLGHNTHGSCIIQTQAKPAPINFESGGLLCPFPWEELGPHLTQCGLGQGLPTWSIQPFGHNTLTVTQKPELHNILHCSQRRTKWQPQEHVQKIRCSLYCGFWATVSKMVCPML